MAMPDLPQPTFKESKFSFSDKLRQIKQRDVHEIVHSNQKSILNYSKHNNSLMRGMIGDQAQSSIQNLIGARYQESLKSISQEEIASQRSLICSRQTDYLNNNISGITAPTGMRSFTQLLRRASSRGSHNTPNNIEESKDEPDFN